MSNLEKDKTFSSLIWLLPDSNLFCLLKNSFFLFLIHFFKNN